MELSQIKQFRVIARTESISKAAEQLFISQPSLIQTLKRLENEVGTPLFERHGRRITLNGAGKIFLKCCDEITAALDNAEKAAYVRLTIISTHIPSFFVIIYIFVLKYPELYAIIFLKNCGGAYPSGIKDLIV